MCQFIYGSLSNSNATQFSFGKIVRHLILLLLAFLSHSHSFILFCRFCLFFCVSNWFLFCAIRSSIVCVTSRLFGFSPMKCVSFAQCRIIVACIPFPSVIFFLSRSFFFFFFIRSVRFFPADADTCDAFHLTLVSNIKCSILCISKNHLYARVFFLSERSNVDSWISEWTSITETERWANWVFYVNVRCPFLVNGAPCALSSKYSRSLICRKHQFCERKKNMRWKNRISFER